MTDPVIIEAALNGGGTKERNPNVPREPSEIVADAIACIDAGASIVHSHIDDVVTAGQALSRRPLCHRVPRDPGRPPGSDGLSDGCARGGPRDQVRASSPAGAGGADRHGSVRSGARPISASPRAPMGCRAGSLSTSIATATSATASNCWANCGSARRWPSTSRASCAPRSVGTRSAGFRAAASSSSISAGGATFQAAASIHSASGSSLLTEKALDAYVEMIEGTGLSWAAVVPGGDLVKSGMAALALARGGHLRVGLEDHAGERQPGNAELVHEAVAACAAAGRRVASPAEARVILDMPEQVEGTPQ